MQSIFRRQLIVGVALAALCLIVSGCTASAPGGAQATATPSAQPQAQTPTAHDPLSKLVLQAIKDPTLVRSIQTNADAQQQTVQVTVTLGGMVPRTSAEIAASQARVKALCFQAQEAVWTSSIITRMSTTRQVTITVLGPLLDDYFDRIVDAYGVAVLESTTARRITWGNLNPDSAWDIYDQRFLRPTYAPNQSYGAPPAASATATP